MFRNAAGQEMIVPSCTRAGLLRSYLDIGLNIVEPSDAAGDFIVNTANELTRKSLFVSKHY
jgi:hypothetical protein